MLNQDRKGPRRMQISRRITLIVGLVIVAATVAGVTFAQADKTGRPSAAAALAQTKRLSEQLAHMPRVRPHHRSHRLTQRGVQSHSAPRAHSAQIDAALKNAANVAGAYALPASPSSGDAAAVPATLPAQVVTEVQKTVVSDALDSSGAESNNSTYPSGGTETVVEVSGTFAAPTAPPPVGGTAYIPRPAKYLIVVTDDETGAVRGVGLGDTPIPLTQMSASVTDATVPQP